MECDIRIGTSGSGTAGKRYALEFRAGSWLKRSLFDLLRNHNAADEIHKALV